MRESSRHGAVLHVPLLLTLLVVFVTAQETDKEVQPFCELTFTETWANSLVTVGCSCEEEQLSTECPDMSVAYFDKQDKLDEVKHTNDKSGKGCIANIQFKFQKNPFWLKEYLIKCEIPAKKVVAYYSLEDRGSPFNVIKPENKCDPTTPCPDGFICENNKCLCPNFDQVAIEGKCLNYVGLSEECQYSGQCPAWRSRCDLRPNEAHKSTCICDPELYKEEDGECQPNHNNSLCTLDVEFTDPRTLKCSCKKTQTKYVPIMYILEYDKRRKQAKVVSHSKPRSSATMRFEVNPEPYFQEDVRVRCEIPGQAVVNKLFTYEVEFQNKFDCDKKACPSGLTCKKSSCLCPADTQVAVNGKCVDLVPVGGACMYNRQCNDPVALCNLTSADAKTGVCLCPEKWENVAGKCKRDLNEAFCTLVTSTPFELQTLNKTTVACSCKETDVDHVCPELSFLGYDGTLNISTESKRPMGNKFKCSAILDIYFDADPKSYWNELAKVKCEIPGQGLVEHATVQLAEPRDSDDCDAGCPSGLECKGGLCKCPNEDTQVAVNGKCLKIAELGEECQFDVQCPRRRSYCKFSLEEDQNGICTCNADHYQKDYDCQSIYFVGNTYLEIGNLNPTEDGWLTGEHKLICSSKKGPLEKSNCPVMYIMNYDQRRIFNREIYYKTSYENVNETTESCVVRMDVQVKAQPDYLEETVVRCEIPGKTVIDRRFITQARFQDNTACSQNSMCATGLVCRNSSCLCPTDAQVAINGMCVSVLQLGESCTYDSQCSAYDPVAFCDFSSVIQKVGTCKCRSGFTRKTKWCRQTDSTLEFCNLKMQVVNAGNDAEVTCKCDSRPWTNICPTLKLVDLDDRKGFISGEVRRPIKKDFDCTASMKVTVKPGSYWSEEAVALCRVPSKTALYSTEVISRAVPVEDREACTNDSCPAGMLCQNDTCRCRRSDQLAINGKCQYESGLHRKCTPQIKCKSENFTCDADIDNDYEDFCSCPFGFAPEYGDCRPTPSGYGGPCLKNYDCKSSMSMILKCLKTDDEVKRCLCDNNGTLLIDNDGERCSRAVTNNGICKVDEDCLYDTQKCRVLVEKYKTCRCPDNAPLFTTEYGCLKNVTFNETCKHGRQCPGRTDCSRETGRCDCDSESTWHVDNCYLNRTLEDVGIDKGCLFSKQCPGGSLCTNGYCRCEKGKVFFEDMCREVGMDKRCIYQYQCPGNSWCADYVCACRDNSFWDGNDCQYQHSKCRAS